MLILLVIFLSLVLGNLTILLLAPTLVIINLILNRGLMGAFYETGGPVFATKATFYYTLLYPVAIWLGVLNGILKYLANQKTFLRSGKAIEIKSRECI